jgi:cell wall-associated NlpC family hydrolase
MTLTPRQEEQAAWLTAHSCKYPRTTVQEAARVGLPLSYALAFLQKESSGTDQDGRAAFGLNLFGSDHVPNPIKGGTVSHVRYQQYLANRRAGRGMQGVGPCQLTWWEFQDHADQLGGCWKPAANMRVGFGIAKALIQKHGKQGGAARYNGVGPAAEDYGRDWVAKQRHWHELLEDVAGGHGPSRTPAKPETKPKAAPKPPPKDAGGGRAIILTSPYMKGRDVKRLQAALNARLRARKLGLQLTADGEYGPETHAAYRDVAYALGLNDATIGQGATIGAQRIIEDPDLRTPEQLALAKKRAAASGSVDKVLRWCESKVGTTESPAGSNRGKQIDKWQAEFDIHATYWCGAFVGYAVRRVGGVPIGNGVVYTPSILAAAHARTGGFAGFYPWKARKKGDLVLMRFPGGNSDPVHHVGIYAGDGFTIEGNTGSDNAGDQSNGGGVYKRRRDAGLIVGCARPRYQR